MAHNPGFLKLVNEAKSRVKETDMAGYKKMVADGSKPVLIDVREDSEWTAGHAKGAIHLGKGVIERDVEQHLPDVGAEIILYCGGGYRSALAADNLQKMGYKKVLSMDGGFRGWKEAKLPVMK